MKRGFILLIIATILWAGNYIAGRYLADAIPATLLNTIRWGLSTVILFSIFLFKGKKVPLLAKWKEFLVTGFYGIFAFSTLNYIALNHISASVAGMISALSPVAILVLTPLILKEKIPTKAWIGTGISVIGVLLLFSGKAGETGGNSFLGQLLMVLACVTWGLYTVYGKKYGKEIDALTMTAGAAFYGTILSALSCIGTVEAGMINLTPVAWGAVIYVSTLASIVAFVTWNMGVGIVGAGTAAPFINLLPVFTVILGLLILSEKLTLITTIGGLIAIGGAILSSIPTKGKR